VINPLLVLALQSLLIWLTVFIAAAPFPRIGTKVSIALIVISTIAICIETIVLHKAGLLATIAVAGYGWGSLAHNYIDKRNKKHETQMLDG
jgi:hypothetical protein